MGRWLAAGLVAICLGSACGERLAASGSTATPSPAALPAASATAISATAVPATIVPDATATATPVVTPLPTPSPTVSPAPPSALTLAQLKYRVIDRFGRLWYCDPDFFPVARLVHRGPAPRHLPRVEDARRAPARSARHRVSLHRALHARRQQRLARRRHDRPGRADQGRIADRVGPAALPDLPGPRYADRDTIGPGRGRGSPRGDGGLDGRRDRRPGRRHRGRDRKHDRAGRPRGRPPGALGRPRAPRVARPSARRRSPFGRPRGR